MNCNTCRYELSQCLDGRLPSGRRSAVMKHTESCSACSTFWTELQAAQRLTLSLKSSSVSDSFRDQLWERIRAGEGTPNAVFHEPTAIWTKVRYTLTGAAAAAAVLLLANRIGDWRDESHDGTRIANDEIAIADRQPVDRQSGKPQPEVATIGGNLQDRVPIRAMDATTALLTSPPLVSSARPLTFDLVAVETARQLEQRYDAALVGMRMMSDPSLNREAGLDKVLVNADEMRSFGELLIDLCDKKRLFFTDDRVEMDLRVAVQMLAQAPTFEDRSPMLVERFVAPALRSDRLGNVSAAITTRPSADPDQEFDALLRLNTTQPEIFRKLFVVLGQLNEIEREFAVPRPGVKFWMADDCGPSWVAPRSEVERHTLLRMFATEGGMVQIQVQSDSR